MAFHFDPRGDLPPSMIQPTSYASSRPTESSSRDHHRQSTYYYDQGHHSRPKRRPCYDWIFSSASNVHVAIDGSAFKTYTSFKSYVLTVADQRKISVKGIGSVELKVRRQPGSKESQTITLDGVLHVPGWLCNIFSDIYFTPPSDYEHTWTDFGVSFLKKQDGQLRYWGFTENFCGLDKLVLSREHRGHSPMLEDKDREVFSVNVTWPQGQRDKWDALVRISEEQEMHKQEREMKLEAQRYEHQMIMKSKTESGLNNIGSLTKNMRGVSLDISRDGRPTMLEISGNVMRGAPSQRTSSLKAPTSSHGSLLEGSH